MDKRRRHHLWTKLRWIKPWYFLAIAIISTVVCVFALRANNQHMVGLRDAVYMADKNDTEVAGALGGLQAYVTAHMNTNLDVGPNSAYPPIQLKYTYERLVEAQNKAAEPSSQLYTEAQHYCEQQNSVDFSGHNRVPCIEQYVQSHGGTKAAAAIPDALYKFDFVSPKWSPDLAGWSMAVAGISWALFIVTLVAGRWLRLTAA